MSCADGVCVLERCSSVNMAILLHVAFVSRYCNDDVIAHNLPQLSHLWTCVEFCELVVREVNYVAF